MCAESLHVTHSPIREIAHWVAPFCYNRVTNNGRTRCILRTRNKYLRRVRPGPAGQSNTTIHHEEQLFMQRLYRVLKALGNNLIILSLLMSALWVLPSSATHAASAAGTLPANWIKGANMVNYSIDPYKIANQHDAIAS